MQGTRQETKPSWDKAPEWANYLAQDRNGGWWWYEKEPEPGEIYWISPGDLDSADAAPNWRESREKRPEQ